MVETCLTGGSDMARTFLTRALLPALAVALLGGCVSDYAYRSDGGGYYYGRPSVEYRYYGGYDYYPYGYYPYGYYSHYRRPYYPGYPYYPVRPYPPYRPPHHHPRPPYKPPVGTRPPHRPDNDRDKAPWRDLDRIEHEQRARRDRPAPRMVPQQVSPPRADARPPRAAPPTHRDRGPRTERREPQQEL